MIRGDRERSEGCASDECIPFDACDGIGKGNGLKGGTAEKRMISDGCDGIGDGNGLQGDTAHKRILSDGCDRIGNDDVCFAVMDFYEYAVLNIECHGLHPFGMK